MKAAVERGEDFSIRDPSILNPRTFKASEITDDEIYFVTNHPLRSWFGTVEKIDGEVKIR